MTNPFASHLTVTLTGIDAFVDPARVQALSAQHPKVEWGILLGRADIKRYPSLDEVKRWSELQHILGINMALHVCGQYAKRWMEEDTEIVQLAQKFPRIQLNIVASRVDIPKLCTQIGTLHSNVITQHHEGNSILTEALRGNPHHSVLFDQSGGRGQAPSSWPQALPDVRCGYAGGMGPDNVTQQLSLIEQVAHPGSWIDMEGRIRTQDDVLDLNLCQSVLEQVDVYCVRSLTHPPRQLG